MSNYHYFTGSNDHPHHGLPVTVMVSALESMQAAGMSSNALFSSQALVVVEDASSAHGSPEVLVLTSPVGLLVFMPPSSIASVQRSGESTLQLMTNLEGALVSRVIHPYSLEDAKRQAQTLDPACARWLAHGHRGASCDALCKLFFGAPSQAGVSHPQEPSDLLRCLQFLEQTGTASRISEAQKLSEPWRALVESWSDLSEILRHERASSDHTPQTYAAMSALLNPKSPARTPKP